MKQFKRIYIEITNCCNLKCSFCPPSRRPSSFMSLTDFEAVLKSIKGHGDYVYLHIKGEPMMHPDFLGFLDLCETYGLKVNLTTNGTFIGMYRSALIQSKALRQVSISFQSQEDLENVANIQSYMKDVLTLIEEGQKTRDLIVELRLWNYQSSEDMGSSDENQLVLEMIKKNLNVDQKTIDQIPIGKGVKLGPQVYLSKSLEFQWPSMELDIIDQVGTCYGLRQQIGILVNGDVVPCCLDGDGQMVLGNLHKESFKSIVTSNRAQDMVEGFEQRKIVEPLCMRCGYRSRFDLS